MDASGYARMAAGGLIEAPFARHDRIHPPESGVR
jgi:hypothetical protein